MSDLYDDPSWNREARNVARELDRNDIHDAQEMMRRDLYQLQNDPRAQHQFINMVNNMDHKGIGADLLISRNQYGQEQWQIAPANYGYNNGYDRNYPVPPPQPMPPEVVVVEPRRESTGEKFVDGLATGAGVGIGLGVMDRLIGGRHRH
jgi:hypothetical protein